MSILSVIVKCQLEAANVQNEVLLLGVVELLKVFPFLFI